MMKFLCSRTVIATAAGTLLAALLLNGVAQAVTDTIFKYSKPKTGYYSISTLDMIPSNSADVYGQSGADQLIPGAGYCFNSGVHLPYRATITALTAWSTSGVNGNPNFYLYRAKMLDSTSDIIAQMHPTDDSGTRKVAHIAIAASNLVDNMHYTYGLLVCLTSGSDIFNGARLTYTYTNAGD